MHIAVQPKHIEEDINGQHCITRGVEKTGLLLLFLDLISFKVRGIHVDEVDGLLVLFLFGKHFQVEFDELPVYDEVRFLHKLEQQQVGDIQDLRLEAEVDAD